MLPFKKLLFYILFSIGAFLGISIISMLGHEYTHYFVGKILGLNPSGPFWSDIKYLAPSVNYNIDINEVSERLWQLKAAHYSGGLTVGLALFIVYLLLVSKGCLEINYYRWGIGLWIIVLAVYQAGQGLLEGGFHNLYVSRGLMVTYVQMAFAMCGLAVHIIATRHYVFHYLHKAIAASGYKGKE